MTGTQTTSAIGIVDDDEAVRDSLASLLAVAGHSTYAFATASEFLNGCEGLELGCVLLDVRLPDADGIDLLERLVDQNFQVPIIIITGHGDVPMAVKAMKIGARDFVQKPFDADALLQTIERALESRERSEQSHALVDHAMSAFKTLTRREHDVMRHVITGQPNKITAYELGLSPRTVEVHRARVMKKTGAKSLTHLVRMAIHAGVEQQP